MAGASDSCEYWGYLAGSIARARWYRFPLIRAKLGDKLDREIYGTPKDLPFRPSSENCGEGRFALHNWAWQKPTARYHAIQCSFICQLLLSMPLFLPMLFWHFFHFVFECVWSCRLPINFMMCFFCYSNTCAEVAPLVSIVHACAMLYPAVF